LTLPLNTLINLTAPLTPAKAVLIERACGVLSDKKQASSVFIHRASPAPNDRAVLSQNHSLCFFWRKALLVQRVQQALIGCGNKSKPAS